MRTLFKTAIIAVAGAVSCFGGATGLLQLQNSAGEERFAFQKSDTIWIQVTDADLNNNANSKESVTILISSSTETAAESVTLQETEVNSGVFRGSIPTETSSSASKDNKLQCKVEDDITVTYNDQSDDWDNSIETKTLGLYGATEIKGTIDGYVLLKKEDSPFILTEVLTIPRKDTLEIEPGVTIRVLKRDKNKDGTPDLNINVLGHIIAKGTEVDSIRFISNEKSPSPGDWNGIVLGVYPVQQYSFADLMYVNIKHSEYGVYTAKYAKGIINFENSLIDSISKEGLYTISAPSTKISVKSSKIVSPFYAIHFDGTEKYCKLTIHNSHLIAGSYGITHWGNGPGDNHLSVIVSNCLIESLSDSITGSGITLNSRIKDSVTIVNNHIKGFETGLKCGTRIYDVTILERNTIEDCNIGYYGKGPILRHNNFINIRDYAVSIYSNENMDARYNYWGPAATAEMENGANPKNITNILDQQDSTDLGLVNYANWLTEPYKENPVSISKQPVDISVPENSSAYFSIETEGGSGQVTYQWYYDDTKIDGATSATYSFTATAADTSASFYCIASDSKGEAKSNSVKLSVTKAITIEIDTSIAIDTTINSKKDTVITKVTTITEVTTIPNKNVIAIQKVDQIGRATAVLLSPNPISLQSEGPRLVVPENMTGEWSITILDILGNTLDAQTFTGKTGEVYQWDMRNRAGDKVGVGSYLALFTIEKRDGTKKRLKQVLTVTE